ncbi:MAG TPA: bifunctional phosphoserine phosphatase/homoserine phosphotransferase ThrH [Candidatus Omnitrophota bacterium]|nr:bifunctional phosphoserine phosphatase/homoserine phosphotransferase ThrH [Candidatus Omnitrophota bacterium]HRY85697.1 bifunctional phosphoserine phosphatase/homoserine phosphotransferase ThrH [Candidatus Omnitrophota bacterium]
MICCLDLEGVLIPEIWINVAKKTGIKALEITTRDEPDYDKLMRYRLGILKKQGIRLRDIQNVIQSMRPLPGAKEFLAKLRTRYQVIILSDTYYEFAGPMMKKLGYPALFCNWLSADKKGFISQYHLRQKNGKKEAVKGLKRLGFKVVAAGDSYNDIAMLRAADRGILFRPPAKIIRQFPRFPVTKTYRELLSAFLKTA